MSRGRAEPPPPPTLAAPMPPPPRGRLRTGSEAPESRQGSESQQLLPGKRQRRRTTFIQDQLHRSERAHNAPLLPPPETPPPSFRGQRERQRSSLQGWEGVKATANGSGASSIAPPHRDRRALLGQLCASAGGLVRLPAEWHVIFYS